MDLITIYIFGLTLSLTVGPMTLLIVQRAITKGLKSGLLTALGLALADGTLALIAFSIGASILVVVSEYKFLVYLFSGIVLLGLALYISWTAFLSFRKGEATQAKKASGKDFISAYLLTLHNPLTLAIFLGFIGNITNLQSIPRIALCAFMLFLGSATGQFSIGILSYKLRGLFKSPSSIFAMNLISSIVIAIFGMMNFLKLIQL